MNNLQLNKIKCVIKIYVAQTKQLYNIIIKLLVIIGNNNNSKI